MTKTFLVCGLASFGITFSVIAQDSEPRLDFKGYIRAHLDWRELEKAGDSEGGQDLLAEALDEVVEPDGSLKGWALNKRTDVVFDSLNLRGRMERSGRLALALREQDRSERMVNAWARSEGAPAEFNCLFDAPVPQMDDTLSNLSWRMRTARASVLDAQGDSLAALELLERTIAEAETINLKGWRMADELRRTYNELGNVLAFLGHWDRAVEVFDRAIADRRLSNHPRVKRSLAMARLNRLFPLAKMKGYSAEIVEEAKTIMNLPGAAPRKNDRAAYERQIAKFEYRAGLVDEARERVETLLREKGGLSRVDRMALERIYFVEDFEHSDENATDAQYEEMLSKYRERGILRSLPTVYLSYAYFLDRADRTQEAIPMVEKAIELSEGNGWKLHLSPLLATLAEMHDRVGTHRAAAKCWARIDAINAELEDSGRGIPEARRVRSALRKIDWLERNGHTKKAIASLAVLRRSAKRDQIGKLQSDTIDSVKIAEKQPDRPKLDAVGAAPIVIEPFATQSVVEPEGVPAKTRFSLLNPGGVGVKGTLRASGTPLVLVALPGGKGVRLELGKGEQNASLPLALAGHERLVIEASALAKVAECKLEWLVGGEVISEASWVISTEKNIKGKPQAVSGTTASVARSSKFYAAPLFQEIRWAKELKRKAKNFRVRTSTESWVRYQLPGGQTIAVDVNGDGDFEDAGDSIASGFDSDNNLLPDALSGGKLGVFGLEIFVFPRSESKKATSVDFELLEEDGSWGVSARNELRKAIPRKR